MLRPDYVIVALIAVGAISGGAASGAAIMFVMDRILQFFWPLPRDPYA
jgi:hypothetical protein